MEKKLIYEDTENQIGVDEDGTIIELCLNENRDEEYSIDSKSAKKIIKEAIHIRRLKKYGVDYDY